MISKQISVPFTDEQVQNLISWQEANWIHRYTCPDRSDEGHFERNGDHGTLVPRVEGLLCVDCGYNQTWAFLFELPENPFEGIL